MPFEFHELTSANGMHYLRIDASGHVDLADAEAFGARLLRPGIRGGNVMSVVSKGTEYSPEARKYFPTQRDNFRKLAVVVTSPIGRAAINVMLRLTRNEGGLVRMFNSESEALAWLESDEP